MESNIILDWLNENSDPEIQKKVELELEKIGYKLSPKNDQECPPFPNASDEDIWVDGFKSGIVYIKSLKYDKN